MKQIVQLPSNGSELEPWADGQVPNRESSGVERNITLSLQGLPGLHVDSERSSDGTHWESWTNALPGHRFTGTDGSGGQPMALVSRTGPLNLRLAVVQSASNRR
jgi:hypothetical protein